MNIEEELKMAELSLKKAEVEKVHEEITEIKRNQNVFKRSDLFSLFGGMAIGFGLFYNILSPLQQRDSIRSEIKNYRDSISNVKTSIKIQNASDSLQIKKLELQNEKQISALLRDSTVRMAQSIKSLTEGLETKKEAYANKLNQINASSNSITKLMDIIKTKSNYEPVLFDVDKLDIRPGSASILDKLVKELMDNPSKEIQLASYTLTPTIDSSYAMKLSEKRGKSVIDFLVNKGISASRINAMAFGKMTNNNEFKILTEMEVLNISKNVSGFTLIM